MYSHSQSGERYGSFQNADQSASLRSKHSYVNVVQSDEKVTSSNSKNKEAIFKVKNHNCSVKPFSIDSQTALRQPSIVQHDQSGKLNTVEEILETYGDIISSSNGSNHDYW